MHFLQKERTEQKTRQLANAKETRDKKAKKALLEASEDSKKEEAKKLRMAEKIVCLFDKMDGGESVVYILFIN